MNREPINPNTPLTNAAKKWCPQCPVLNDRDGEVCSAEFTASLELKLNEALKWKEADPRMYQEQYRVSDVAFQALFNTSKEQKEELVRLQQVTKEILFRLERIRVRNQGGYLGDALDRDDCIKMLNELTHFKPQEKPVLEVGHE